MSKPRIRSDIRKPKKSPVATAKPRTLREALVDRYLSSRAKEEIELREQFAARQSAALTAMTRFFNMTEAETKLVKLFEFGDEYGCEIHGLSLIPIGQGFQYLGKCAYCKEECPTMEIVANMVDLGRLIYEDSETGIRPDRTHLTHCKEAPTEKKVEAGIASPTEQLIDTLRQLLRA